MTLLKLPHGRRAAGAAAATLLLAGCSGYPQDVENTYDHVVQSHSLRAGIVAAPPSVMAEERALARRIATAHGARPRFAVEASELLLRDLEQGRLDVVIGRFATKSPWTGKVALTGPAGAVKPAKDEPVLRAAVRAGENHWLLEVDRDVGGTG